MLHISKCTKTHLHQRRISKIFLGEHPRTSASRALEGDKKGGRERGQGTGEGERRDRGRGRRGRRMVITHPLFLG